MKSKTNHVEGCSYVDVTNLLGKSDHALISVAQAFQCRPCVEPKEATGWRGPDGMQDGTSAKDKLICVGRGGAEHVGLAERLIHRSRDVE
jgi:hypothetical protein